MIEVVHIARCPDHGLHGARRTCFICEGEVEQVAMVPLAEYERLRQLTFNLLAAADHLPGAYNGLYPFGQAFRAAGELVGYSLP